MVTKSLLALAIVASVAALGAPVALADDSGERGIVQYVAPRKLSIRVLDGSTVVLTVDSRAKVSVDGRKAALPAVRPGFVVVVTLDDGVAREVKAYDPARTVTVPPPDGKSKGKGDAGGSGSGAGGKDESQKPKSGRSPTR